MATEICKQFLAGKCSRSKCKFLHDVTATSVSGDSRSNNSKSNKKETSVCRDFLRGTCKFGESCKFSHQGGDAATANLSTKVCHQFKRGTCRFGSECLYAHAEKEAVVCKAFRAGRCIHGALCKFLHSSGGLVGSSAQSAKTMDIMAKTSEQICFAFKNGTCTFGQNCKFAHVDSSELALLKKDKKRRCFPFQKGQCRRGDLCKFQHILGSASNFVGRCFAWQKEGSCIKGDACRFEHAGSAPAGVPTTPTTGGNVQYCYRFKKKGICAKGDACEFAHIPPTVLADGTTADAVADGRLPLNTSSPDAAALRATWKALKNGNAEKAVVKEAKNKYKAAKELALQSANVAVKRAAPEFEVIESIWKKPKLSKKERNKKAHVIRSRGISIPGRRR
jgi:hypothetical protein